MKCSKETEHEQHMCQLKGTQQFAKVKEITREARFFCEICDATAKSADNLCAPKQFKGNPGVLKWR
jgi:hypothetical protein